MNIKTIGIGAGIGAAIASGVIFGIQAALRSARRKGTQEGAENVLHEQAIGEQAVKAYRAKRFTFLKGRES